MGISILAIAKVWEITLQVGIPALASAIIVLFNTTIAQKNRHDDKDTAENKKRTDAYGLELDQLNKQREMLYNENAELRNQLKEELEDCRHLRQEMEVVIAELKAKIETIEAELFAWRNALKVPSGYALVKIPLEDQEGESKP